MLKATRVRESDSNENTVLLASNVQNTTGQKIMGRPLVIDLIAGGFSALFKKETVSNWAYNGFGESHTNKIVY